MPRRDRLLVPRSRRLRAVARRLGGLLLVVGVVLPGATCSTDDPSCLDSGFDSFCESCDGDVVDICAMAGDCCPDGYVFEDDVDTLADICDDPTQIPFPTPQGCTY